MAQRLHQWLRKSGGIYIYINGFIAGWWFGNMADIFFYSVGTFMILTNSYFSEGLKPPTRYGLIGLQNLRRFHVVPLFRCV